MLGIHSLRSVFSLLREHRCPGPVAVAWLEEALPEFLSSWSHVGPGHVVTAGSRALHGFLLFLLKP